MRTVDGVAHTIVIDDEQDDPVDLENLGRLLAGCLQRLDVDTTTLAVRTVERSAIAALNRTHLGGDGPTDVLAFPLDDAAYVRGDAAPTGSADAPEDAGPPHLLGDIVLCPAVAADQAPADAGAELELLTVHGLLHLLGHDHAEAGERAVMFGLTDRLLAAHRSEP